MTIQQLQRGTKISDQIDDLDRCIECIERRKVDDNKTPVLVDFLTKWNNVGTSTIKKECASVAFDAILEYLTKQKECLQNEFKNL